MCVSYSPRLYTKRAEANEGLMFVVYVLLFGWNTRLQHDLVDGPAVDDELVVARRDRVGAHHVRVHHLRRGEDEQQRVAVGPVLPQNGTIQLNRAERHPSEE